MIHLHTLPGVRRIAPAVGKANLALLLALVAWQSGPEVGISASGATVHVSTSDGLSEWELGYLNSGLVMFSALLAAIEVTAVATLALTLPLAVNLVALPGLVAIVAGATYLGRELAVEPAATHEVTAV